jgi:hypothetical protein
VKALRILAGSRALAHLKERGLSPADVRAIPAAAGGAKGLALLPLERLLFGEWLPQSTQTVHLLGASIGAWRMAVACLPDPAARGPRGRTGRGLHHPELPPGARPHADAGHRDPDLPRWH